MKVFMLWHGGSSYAPADQFNRKDIEQFDSIAEAKRAFAARGEGSDSYYPCVDTSEQEAGGASAWLCFSDPYQIPDLYPDRVMTFGPRGGVRVEPA